MLSTPMNIDYKIEIKININRWSLNYYLFVWLGKIKAKSSAAQVIIPAFDFLSLFVYFSVFYE